MEQWIEDLILEHLGEEDLELIEKLLEAQSSGDAKSVRTEIDNIIERHVNG